MSTDDFGTLWIEGAYTKRLFPSDTAVNAGHYTPAGLTTPVWDALDYKEAKKAVVFDFEVSEGNCNTCRYLERVTHEKNAGGWLYGKCYKNVYLKFHPDDPMNMVCHSHRRGVHAVLTQPVECGLCKAEVVGSIPSDGTNNHNKEI